MKKFKDFTVDDIRRLEAEDTPAIERATTIPPSEWLYIERRHFSLDRMKDVRRDDDVEHYITEPRPINSLPGFFSAWQIDEGKQVTIYRRDIIHRPYENTTAEIS